MKDIIYKAYFIALLIPITIFGMGGGFGIGGGGFSEPSSSYQPYSFYDNSVIISNEWYWFRSLRMNVYFGKFDRVKHYLEMLDKCDPNLDKQCSLIEKVSSCCFFNHPKISRLLLLYGCRFSPKNIAEKKLKKIFYPALSEIMQAACLGDIKRFNNLHNKLSDRDSLYNKITGSYKHAQGRLNAALRYAAANLKEDMFKYLLFCGANQFARCPDVAKDIASTEDLIIRLKNREKSDSNFKSSYDRIIYIFRNHRVSNFYRAKKLYWQLRLFAQNPMKDLIPNMILTLDPEITKQECAPELMKKQIEEIENSFWMIHNRRTKALLKNK